MTPTTTHVIQRSWLALGLAIALISASAPAQENEAKQEAEKAAEKAKEAVEKAEEAVGEAAQSEGPETKLLVTNLDNPCGLAIHGPSGDVFIATHVGVYRYSPSQPDRSKMIHLHISGFPTDKYGKGPIYDIGPLGLAFWGDDRLVVGDGSRVDGEELVRIYKLEEEKEIPHPPVKEDSAEFTLGPIGPGEESVKGEGNFYGVAVTENAIYLSTNGDDTKGWVARIPIEDGKPGELKPYIATKEKTEVNAPVPLTLSPDGKELVVGQMGTVTNPNDSLLTSYDPASGELKMNHKLSLHDIAAIAYNPKNGKLYAADFAWVDPSQGALYRLDINGSEVNAEKILSLDKPTAMAFDKEGNLYITIFGTATEQQTKDNKSPGQLLRIAAADLD